MRKTPITDALNQKCAGELNEHGVNIGDHYIAMREHAERLEQAYRYLQDRMESIGYQGWAHDMDDVICPCCQSQPEVKSALNPAAAWPFPSKRSTQP